MDKYAVLKKHFGYDSFRKGQEIIIDEILSKRDCLGIMPTGAGKSICFQVPAMCFTGITLVISPLISLMKDQVNSLIQSGIRGAYLNSSLTYNQYIKALENAKLGLYKIIYVAPERLMTESFLSFAKSAHISMITIDEAHCVSQWGHDFRPGYLKIKEFIELLPKRPVVSAFTATATKEVKEDIIKMLNLKNHFETITGFDRPNLYFEVRHPKNKMSELLKLLSNYQSKTGIVYCSTRKNVEEVCERLNQNGIKATRYHAGLDVDERRKNQESFLYDESNIMVATNAFGMGIDKSDVSFVIHYNMPKNMEGYYQEAGRAGRDGSKADCILLYSASDVITNKFLIENTENEELDKDIADKIKKQDLDRLNKMNYYCNTVGCLREYILRYFGEQPKDNCKNCSNCNGKNPALDVTKESKWILYAINKTGQNFGKMFIAELLCGSDNERIRNFGFKDSEYYGVLTGVKIKTVLSIIDSLIANDYIAVTHDKYPVLQLTKRANDIALGKNKIFIRKDEKLSQRMKKESYSTDINIDLFNELKKERARFAKIQGVPSFVVFTDASLKDMCIKMPINTEEFLGVSGVGYNKMERYSKRFIDIIKKYKN